MRTWRPGEVLGGVSALGFLARPCNGRRLVKGVRETTTATFRNSIHRLPRWPVSSALRTGQRTAFRSGDIQIRLLPREPSWDRRVILGMVAASSAAPLPVIRGEDQAGCDWIVFDVSDSRQKMPLVADEPVPIVALPQWRSLPSAARRSQQANSHIAHCSRNIVSFAVAASRLPLTTRRQAQAITARRE